MTEEEAFLSESRSGEKDEVAVLGSLTIRTVAVGVMHHSTIEQAFLSFFSLSGYRYRFSNGWHVEKELVAWVFLVLIPGMILCHLTDRLCSLTV